jgi:hypothetical protein
VKHFCPIGGSNRTSPTNILQVQERTTVGALESGGSASPSARRPCLGKLIERAAQLNAVSLRAAGCFIKNLRGSGGARLLHLRVEALAVRRYACTAQNHGMILGYILHLKSPFLSMGFLICKNLDFSTTKLVPKPQMSFDRKSFSQKTTPPSGGLSCVHCGSSILALSSRERTGNIWERTH